MIAVLLVSFAREDCRATEKKFVVYPKNQIRNSRVAFGRTAHRFDPDTTPDGCGQLWWLKMTVGAFTCGRSPNETCDAYLTLVQWPVVASALWCPFDVRDRASRELRTFVACGREKLKGSLFELYWV